MRFLRPMYYIALLWVLDEAELHEYFEPRRKIAALGWGMWMSGITIVFLPELGVLGFLGLFAAATIVMASSFYFIERRGIKREDAAALDQETNMR